jgi:hypothetical protein
MRMRTLQQLAESYERWAADEEAVANRIIAGLNILNVLGKELRVKQLQSAEALLQEALVLRQEAAQLRETWSSLIQPPLLENDASLAYSKAASQFVLRQLNVLRLPH